MRAERNIRYNGKDFDDLRSQLIEFSKNYFPDSYTDFSPTSPGMMFMEMAAYVGDILSFYQDIQVQETFMQYAKNPTNLYAIAYLMGYRPKVTTVAEAVLTIRQEVDAIGPEYDIDWGQTYRVAEHSSVVSDTYSDTNFLLRDPVDFSYSSSYDPTSISIGSTDDGGNPKTYLLTKKVKAFSGTVKSIQVPVGSYQKFFTFELPDKNIVGILDITDSDGNVWTEVPYLGQDTVFVDQEEVDGKPKVPYVLELKKVPRRFVTRFTEKNKLQVQFGAGMVADDNDEQNYFPNPLSLEASIQELSADRYDQAYDPSNFLFSKSYGLAPVNTQLVVRYVTGGGVRANVPANSLTKNGTLYLSASGTVDIDPSRISFNNEEAATGGRDGDTLEEIRQNSLRSFAEQKRVVTLSDYNVRSLSMPPKYGVVSKAYAVNESTVDADRTSLVRNPLAITLYVLAEDMEGNLIKASELVKKNLRTYLSNYIMITDAVDIKDAYVVNIGVQYDLVLRPGYRSADVLLECNRKLQDFFSTDKRQINEVINLSNAYTLLDQVQGVQTVKDIKIINKVGEGYSEFAYDMQSAVRDKMLYPSYDPCIFEVKYPDFDIEGRVVSL